LVQVALQVFPKIANHVAVAQHQYMNGFGALSLTKQGEQ